MQTTFELVKSGQQARDLRKNCELTQSLLSKHIGVTAPTISAWERQDELNTRAKYLLTGFFAFYLKDEKNE